MGLYSEVVKVNRYQQEQQKNIKEIEKMEHEKQKIEQKKQREKNLKQYEKGMLTACKKDLRCKFDEGFEEKGINAKFDFFNIETRNKLIQEIAKTEFEGDCLEDNYNKILNETIKKYELNQKYLEEQQRIEDEKQRQEAEQFMEEMAPIWEEQRRKEEQRQKIKNVFVNIEKFIAFLLNNPLLFLFICGLIFAIWFIYNTWQLALPILNS